MAREGRPLFRIMFQNFINSFKPRKLNGNLVGEDYFGNKFYEVAGDASKGQRKQRYFEPPGKRDINDPEDHGHEIASEWQSWLRGRRKEPPTQEELKKNLSIMQMKKQNAALLDEKFGAKFGAGASELDHASLKKNVATGKAEFPRYDEEYESIPGVKPIKKEE